MQFTIKCATRTRSPIKWTYTSSAAHAQWRPICSLPSTDCTCLPLLYTLLFSLSAMYLWWIPPIVYVNSRRTNKRMETGEDPFRRCRGTGGHSQSKCLCRCNALIDIRLHMHGPNSLGEPISKVNTWFTANSIDCRATACTHAGRYTMRGCCAALASLHLEINTSQPSHTIGILIKSIYLFVNCTALQIPLNKGKFHGNRNCRQ